MFVDGPFRNLVNGADANGFFCFVRQGICYVAEGLSNINRLSITWIPDICAAVLYRVQPALLAFLAWISLDDKRNVGIFVAFLHKNTDVVGSVISRIKADEQRLVCQLAAKVDGLP